MIAAPIEINVALEPTGLAQLDRLLLQLPIKFHSGVRRAVNYGLRRARTQIVLVLRQRINLKRKDVVRYGKLWPVWATQRTPLMGSVSLSPIREPQFGYKRAAGRIPLYAFGARETKRGVRYAITKGKTKKVPHAFIATMKSTHTGVFLRGRYVMKGGLQRITKPHQVGTLPLDIIAVRRIAGRLRYQRVGAGAKFVSGHGWYSGALGWSGASKITKKEPIYEVFGPSIAGDLAHSPEGMSAIRVDVTTAFTAELMRQLDLVVKGGPSSA